MRHCPLVQVCCKSKNCQFVVGATMVRQGQERDKVALSTTTDTIAIDAQDAASEMFSELDDFNAGNLDLYNDLDSGSESESAARSKEITSMVTHIAGSWKITCALSHRLASALITSDFDAVHVHEHQMALITSDCCRSACP